MQWKAKDSDAFAKPHAGTQDRDRFGSQIARKKNKIVDGIACNYASLDRIRANGHGDAAATLDNMRIGDQVAIRGNYVT